MSTAVVKFEPQSVAANERTYTPEQVDLIKATVAKGTTDDEFKLFLYVCQKTGLDPFVRQIHAVKRWSKKDSREVMSIQTGIDGYRLIAERTGKYMPDESEPQFTYVQGSDEIEKCAVYVKKWHEASKTWNRIPGVAYWKEYVQMMYSKENQAWQVTPFWRDKPHIMLAKCAEAIALRKAFPQELSSVYTHEEMMQADNFTVGPEVREATKPGRCTYRTEWKGKDVTGGGHTFEKGCHEYCAKCAEDWEKLTDSERLEYAIKYAEFIKASSAPVSDERIYEPITPSTAAANAPPPKPKGAVISDAQGKRFYAISRTNGWGDGDVDALLQEYGLASSRDIPRTKYEEICERLKGPKPTPAQGEFQPEPEDDDIPF